MERPYGIAALDRPRRLPRAGRIRLGEKQVNEKGKEYPRELDYFNLVDAALVAQVYGDTPRELDVLFPVNDPRAVLDLCYMMYGKTTGWKCRGDGRVAWHRERDEEIECLGEDCPAVQDKACKRQGTLTFICPLVPGLCVYDIVTGSWRTIENWMALIETLQDLFGRIDGIPLKLYREPYQTSYTDADGKTHAQTHHCCRLDVAASLYDVRRLQFGGGQPLEIEPATDECADDMYPRSLQQAEVRALPQRQEVIPADPDPAEAEGLGPVSSELLGQIRTGWTIVDVTSEEKQEIIERFRGQPEKLRDYLSALATMQDTAPAAPAPAPQVPRPVPRVDQRPKPKPAPQTAPRPAPAQKKAGWSF